MPLPLQRHRSSSKLQFKEIDLDSAKSVAGLSAGIQVKPGAVAVPSNRSEPKLRLSKADAEKIRLVKESLSQQQQLHCDWDEIDSATVASTRSTRSWWGRTRGRGGRGAKASATREADDNKSVTSVMSRFSIFGDRRKQKKKSKAKLTQDRIISEFFDVQSVANDGRLHDRLNQERVVAKFFDVQSVQTDTPGSRKRFSLFRRNRKDDLETKSVASLGSIGIIFFHPTEIHRGPVPDDETITLASGLLSCANSVILEESESSSGDDLVAFPVPGEHHLQSSSSSIGAASVKIGSSSTSSFIQEVTMAQQQDSMGQRRPLKLPNPTRPSLADFDRWSSQSSVTSFTSEPSVGGTAPKQPSRRRMSGSNPEESKVCGPGEQSDEESVVSLLSGIVANYAAAKAQYDHRRSAAARVSAPSKPSLKKDVLSNRPSYNVIFDTVIIREYARTVGDNPSCTCGPPVTLDWHYLSCEATRIDDYEASKPVKRTKKQFYLPARRRASILMDDWGVTDEELKRARREVTYIQYCRERSVTGARSSAQQEGSGPVRRAGKMSPSPPTATPDDIPPSGEPPLSPSSAGKVFVAAPSPLTQEPPASPPKRKIRSLSPPGSPVLNTGDEADVDLVDLRQATPSLNDVGEEDVISVSNPQDQHDVMIPPLETEYAPSKLTKSKLSRQNSLSSLGSLEPIRLSLEQSSRRRMEI